MIASRRMHLDEIARSEPQGPRGEIIRALEAAGRPVSGLLRLFAYKPDRTELLAAFTQAVMRGPSKLSAGERELVAAMTSAENQCVF